MMYRILIVEDDPSIAAGLSYALEKEGYFVTQCRSVAEAFEVSEAVHFDLAVLDMQLPDGAGKEIGQKLQAEQTQVIYLTVVDDEDEIVHTLENGAADYVTKPFRMRELMVRIRRILNIKTEEQQVIRLGDAVIDANAGKVFVKDQQILLTALEYRLLLIFAENPSILLTREQLLERIWDISGDFVEKAGRCCSDFNSQGDRVSCGSVKKKFWSFQRGSRKPLREKALTQGMKRKAPGVFLKMIFIHC